MQEFEKLVKLLFYEGGKSFLKKGDILGDDETFYMHCLRCYIPKIVEIIY